MEPNRDCSNHIKIAYDDLIHEIHAGVQICEYNSNLTLVYANEEFYSLSGFSMDEYQTLTKNEHLSALCNKKDLIRQSMKKQIGAKGTYHVEYYLQDKQLWILERGKLINNTMIQCILMDISEYKMLEEKLRVSERRYEVAIDYSEVTLYDYDIRTKDMIFNDYDMQIFDLPRVLNDSVNKLVQSKFIHPNSVAEFYDLYKKIDEGAPFGSAIITIVLPNKSERVYEMSLTTLYDEDGMPQRAIGVKKDVTERLELQREKEYYESSASGKIFAFEANLTQDIFMKLSEGYGKGLDIEVGSNYTQGIIEKAKTILRDDYRDDFMVVMNKDYLIQLYNKGKGRIVREYLRKSVDDGFRWVEQTINIIKDKNSNDIIIRCYLSDIHERKEKEILASTQQKHYERMFSKSSRFYEANITRNKLLYGNERWNKLDNFKSCLYQGAIEEYASLNIHINDREQFVYFFSCESLLSHHRLGNDNLNIEYRSLMQADDYEWIRCTLNLVEDEESGDLFAEAYIEQINEEKEKQLQLIYKAQHDLLTSVLNRNTLEERISEFLVSLEGKHNIQAFMIIDLDYFKAINDNFGHAFGDAVLSRVAGKIKKLFRENDIIGRIGGDEFVVFMKNIRSKKIAYTKANEIIEEIYETYRQNGIDFKISTSIGIAFYPNDGSNYQELYEHSDNALYYAKEHGRACWCEYSSKMQTNITKIKEIDQNAYIESKSFDENIIEYVFRILYESSDKEMAIHAVLELMGKHYNVSRTYVFEDSADGYETHNTFEWCAPGVLQQKEKLKSIAYADLGDYKQNFNDEGVFYMPDINFETAGVRNILESQGVKSMLQFSITKKGKFIGFIGFDQCFFVRKPTAKEISDAKSIANILGVFISEMRTLRENERISEMALSIVNGLDSYAYVCNPKTYEIMFINDKTKDVAPDARVGQLCYKAFWNAESPCELCPMKQMENNHNQSFALDIYNPHLDLYIRSTASWIKWFGHEKACLVDSVDISKYIKETT